MENQDPKSNAANQECPPIHVYGSNWCGDCLRARRLLDKYGINYAWIDVGQDKQARSFVIETNHGYCSIPTIVFEDGSVLVEPSNQALLEKLGL
jgi:mycoredoxin